MQVLGLGLQVERLEATLDRLGAHVGLEVLAEAVLQRMQVLDELVAIAAGAGEQGLELGERGGVGLAAAQAGTGAATGGGLER